MNLMQGTDIISEYSTQKSGLITSDFFNFVKIYHRQ